LFKEKGRTNRPTENGGLRAGNAGGGAIRIKPPVREEGFFPPPPPPGDVTSLAT